MEIHNHLTLLLEDGQLPYLTTVGPALTLYIDTLREKQFCSLNFLNELKDLSREVALYFPFSKIVMSDFMKMRSLTCLYNHCVVYHIAYSL